MSAAGNVTFKMTYFGAPFFYSGDEATKIQIERITVQMGEKENYFDTYFVDFDKLASSASCQFESDTTKKVTNAISVPLEAVKAIFVRLEGRVGSTQIAVTAKSTLTEFTPDGEYLIYLDNFDGIPKVMYLDSKGTLNDNLSDSSDQTNMDLFQNFCLTS